MRADFKLIAKYVVSLRCLYTNAAHSLTTLHANRAFGRIGSAHLKLDDYASAIKAFQKSLTEHRTPDVLQKLKDVSLLSF